MGVSAGLIRIMYLKSSNVADIIPADIVINTVLAAGERTFVERFNGPGRVKGVTKIYNCISGNDNPITYGKSANAFDLKLGYSFVTQFR